jgi:hypothetical protein
LYRELIELFKTGQGKNAKRSQQMSPVPEGAYRARGEDEINLNPEAEALVALNAALGGVQALQAAVALMESAAAKLAAFQGDGVAPQEDIVKQITYLLGKIQGHDETFRVVQIEIKAINEELDKLTDSFTDPSRSGQFYGSGGYQPAD